MSEDCYFFVDVSVPEEQRTMSTLCLECQEKFMPDGGWFYPGSHAGYGPFDFTCCKCEKIIHKAGEDEEI